MRRLMGVAAASVLAGCAAAPAGDAARGRELFIARDAGHCVLCHAAPGVTTAGNVGPALGGIGSRLAPEEIRQRVADITQLNPNAVMPVFFRTEGLTRVAPEYRGKTALSEQQLDDIVAWLSTLK